VLVEVGTLGEGELTAKLRALVEPLSRVNAQMIENVVPLAEHHSAEGSTLTLRFVTGILKM